MLNVFALILALNLPAEPCPLCECVEEIGAAAIFGDAQSPDDLASAAPSCLSPASETRLSRAVYVNAHALRAAIAPEERGACQQRWRRLIEGLAQGSSASCASPEARREAAPVETETIARCDIDQTSIDLHVSGAAEPGALPDCSAARRMGLTMMVLVRIENTAYIRRLVDDTPALLEGRARYFWNALYYLGQHAEISPEIQERLLAQVAAAAERGEVPVYNYAALADRIAMTQSGHQLYGTHTSCDGVSAVIQPPLDNPEAADARRAELALEPLRAFLSQRSAARCQ